MYPRSISVVDGMPMEPSGQTADKKGPRRFSCPPGTVMENAVLIKRPPFTQAAFDELHLRTDGGDEKKTWKDKLKAKCVCSKQKLWKAVSSFLPIIKVIRYYNIKENIVTDILSGITIGILHIPQALAFGLLTSVKVENGLYTSVWPIILYVIFGTSAHVSMGTSAVICIVTAAVVDRQADQFKETYLQNLNSTGNATEITVWEDIPEFMDYKEGVALAIAFYTGAILLLMGMLRLGFITAYLSDSFFAAFTSGAGVHIATSQIPAILGLKINRYGGVFKIIKTYRDIFSAITQVNFASFLIALLSGVIILLVKDCINERFKSKLVVPIPIELFVVIISTLVSYFVGLSEKFGVDIVNEIPGELPVPIMPPLSGFQDIIVDCFVLAILIFANTIAMAKICAKRHNYEVDDSQEMIAYGACNFASSFLKCFPSAVAPPRSMVASSMNTKSTLSGLFSAALMILLILVMSSLFEPLPKAALAAMIVVALKGLFIQIKVCVDYWRINKIDFVIWFFTIISVVFLDIDFGLGIGVVVSLITVVFQAQFSRGYRVGRTMKDSALVEHKRYTDSLQIPGIKIFRFHSSIFFANAEIFRMALYRGTVNPRKILKFMKKQERKQKSMEKKGIKTSNDAAIHYGQKQEKGGFDEAKIRIDITAPDSKGMNGNGVHPTDSSVLSSKPKFQRLDSSSSGGSSRKTSMSGIDNPVYRDDVQLTNGNGQYPVSNGQWNSLQIPGYLGQRSNSVATVTTIAESDTEDPDDGGIFVSEERFRHMRRTHTVILDCSTLNYLDASGANVISHISSEYDHVNIKLFLACVSRYVRETMEHAGVFEKIPQNRVFLDVHDAIAAARNEMVLPLGEVENFSYEEAAEDSYITKM